MTTAFSTVPNQPTRPRFCAGRAVVYYYYYFATHQTVSCEPVLMT